MTLSKWKEFGLRFNAGFETYMFLLIPVSMILGFLFSGAFRGLTAAVPYLFGFLTFVMALDSSFRRLGQTLRRPGPLLLTLLLAHAAAPAAAYGMGAALFGSGSPYVVGLVMFTIIPLGVSSVIWIGISGGSVPLALSLIVLDSALSPLIVPAEIYALFGAHISFDVWRVMQDLLFIVVLPTLLGVLVHQLSRDRAKPVSAPLTAPLSKLCMFAVVMINAAAIAPEAGKLRSEWLLLMPAVVVLVAVCYLLGFAGVLFGRRDVAVAMFYASGMRNISLGLVLAIGYFEPPAALPVMLSTLIQQPMANLMHSLLRVWTRRTETSRGGFTKPS